MPVFYRFDQSPMRILEEHRGRLTLLSMQQAVIQSLKLVCAPESLEGTDSQTGTRLQAADRIKQNSVIVFHPPAGFVFEQVLKGTVFEISEGEEQAFQAIVASYTPRKRYRW